MGPASRGCHAGGGGGGTTRRGTSRGDPMTVMTGRREGEALLEHKYTHALVYLGIYPLAP